MSETHEPTTLCAYCGETEAETENSDGLQVCTECALDD